MMTEWVTQSFRLRLGTKRPSRRQLLTVIAEWNYPYCGLIFFMRQWWLSLSHQPGLDILFCERGQDQHSAHCGWIIADTQPARLVVWRDGRLAAIEQGDVGHLLGRINAWQAEYSDLNEPRAWFWCSQQPAPALWCGNVLSAKECFDSFVRLLPVEHYTQRSSASVKWGIGIVVIVSLAAAWGIAVVSSPANETEQANSKQMIKRIDSAALINQLGMLMSHPFYQWQRLTRIDVTPAGMRLTWQKPNRLGDANQGSSRVEMRQIPLASHTDVSFSRTASNSALLSDYRQQFFDAQIAQQGASQWMLSLDMMSFRHLETLLRWLREHPYFSLSSLTMRYQHGYWSVQWTLENTLGQSGEFDGHIDKPSSGSATAQSE
ncbi:hypothetical protein DFP83_101155 [Idiomarina fontislapidosi]|nr:hypothetical protein [Idiomarina fontislapidosi]PYE35280.1 hypothetical protein DFP83_101155 [Idiomarina fontislapidosi]